MTTTDLPTDLPTDLTGRPLSDSDLRALPGPVQGTGRRAVPSDQDTTADVG